jgi:uncharacterized membrane protein YphA (DoxX/SURF4 family)
MTKRPQISHYTILSIAIGLVYLWFGGLKFFSGGSPAERLALDVINWLTLGLIPENIAIILLAIWETLIGVLLIINIYRKIAVYIALVHMACTFLPLFIFPDQSFTEFPLGFTLVGQYIFKNIIIVSALFILLKQYKAQIV